MTQFESLLEASRSPVERFVRFRIKPPDADDVLQEVYLTAYRRFGQLREPEAFKAWIISIARSKCADYFREKSRIFEIPIEELEGSQLAAGRSGIVEDNAVLETLELLGPKDKQMLYLYYWKELPQAEIARRLDLPLGTVKSRLHTAKKNFKDKYDCEEKQKKGGYMMKKLPGFLPEFTIVPSTEPPFPVRWEELMGWLLVPRLGERLSWAMYDMPQRKRTELCEMEVLGRAEVHGIEGVEIRSLEYEAMECNRLPVQEPVERRFVAQLTETHCRYLAESQVENGVRKLRTFLDGGAFLDNWGFGENNCGNEVLLSPKGDIVREGDVITSKDKKFLLDVVGRYQVTIGGKTYDTVCVMDIETYNDGVASEQFLDKNGRTILWRRFNRDDWAIKRYKKPWTELLPENDRLIVDGKVYVNWYNCITDYIL